MFHLLAFALAASVMSQEPAPAPLIAHSSGLPVAEVRVEGHGPYRFVIDTAASNTVVLPALRNVLPITLERRDGQQVNGASGSAEVPMVGIRQLETQGRQFANLTAFDMPPGPVDALQVHGILGADVIAHAILDIDPQAAAWAIRDTAPVLPEGRVSHRVPITLDNARAPRVTVRIDGVTIEAVVDTGARASIVNWRAASLLGLSPTTEGLRQGSPIKGVSSHATANVLHTARELQIGGASIKAPEFRVADLPVFIVVGLADKPAIILGMDQLKHFRTIIDYRGGEMTLIPATGAEAKASD